MEKKYKLLKDLPDAKVGEVFTLDTSMFHPRYVSETTCDDGCKSIWPPNIVENNTSWFQEIVETKYPKGILGIKSDRKQVWLCNPFSEENYQYSIKTNMENGGVITSVQNSSGKVFSVGDEVECYGDKYSIINFSIHEGELFARIHDCMRVSIDNLTKPSAPKTFTKAEIEKALNIPFIGRIGRTEFKRTLGI